MSLCRCVPASLRCQSIIVPVFLYLALVVPFSTNSPTLSTRWSFCSRITLVRAAERLFNEKQYVKE